MYTFRRTAMALIWPAVAWLGACDQTDAPTAPMFSVIPPGGGPGKVTGGGQIPIVDAQGATIGTATFGFNAKLGEETDAVASGHLNYVNHVTGEHLNCKVTMVGVTPAPNENSPGTADFSSYDCTRNSSAQDVLVHVEDFGEPGDADVFLITINDVEPAAGGVIRSGNIQVHK